MVVKVRRPDVEVGVARDSAVLRWATRTAVRRSEAARSLGLVALADELIRSVEQELELPPRGGERQGPVGGVRGSPRRAGSDAVISEFSTDAVLVHGAGRRPPVSDAAAVDA